MVDKSYSLRITNTFEILLDSLIKAKVEGRYNKVDLKVHIKGTRVSVIHHGAPVALLKQIIQKDVITSYMPAEKGIIVEEDNSSLNSLKVLCLI